jgi:uncharacterized membrane protein
MLGELMSEKQNSSMPGNGQSASPDTTRPEDPADKIEIGLWAIAVLAGVIVVLYICNFASEGWSPKQDHWGQFGDFFGGTLNPIIGLMTLSALVWTVRLQHQLLREAKRQVKVSEDELKRTSEALERQAALQRKQAFETTFFSLLSAWQRLCEQMDLLHRDQRKTGKDCFVIIHDDFHQFMNDESFRYRNVRDEVWGFVHSHVTKAYEEAFWSATVDAPRPRVVEAYVLTYHEHRTDLGAYFRTLYHLIKFIDKSGLTERERRTYANLVRAQFSPYEHFLLFYNCLSPFGCEKFYPLIERYALLKNLDESLLITKDDKHYYRPPAWASSPTVFQDEQPDRIELAIRR